MSGHCLEYAIYHSPLPFIRALLDLGAEPNYGDHHGFPSVIAALSTDRDDKYQIIELLIVSGTDVNHRGVNDYTPLHYAAALSLGGVVLLPVLALRFDATNWPTVTAIGWGATAYLALFVTILAYVAWYWALARGGTARVGSVQFAQPVVALAAAVTAMGEVFTPPLALATVAILAGIAIAQRA